MDFPHGAWLQSDLLADSLREPHVLGGLYLAWLIDRDLLDEELALERSGDLRAVAARRMTGAELYVRWGGVLDCEVLSIPGNLFTVSYLDGDLFWTDLERTFGDRVPELAGTWAEYGGWSWERGGDCRRSGPRPASS